MTNGSGAILERAEPTLQAKNHRTRGSERVMEPLILDCSENFDPVVCIGTGWSISQQEERTAHLVTVDFSIVEYPSHVKPLERSIPGGIKHSRVKRDPESRLPLAVRHFWGLLQDYNNRVEDPEDDAENSVLEYLRLWHPKHITCVDFFGTTLQDPEGFKRIAYLWYDDKHWKHDYRFVSSDAWHRRCTSAMLPARFLQS